VVLPLLEHDAGYSNTQLANVIFAFSLFYAVGQLCCGVLSDRFGPRLIVGIGLFLVVISSLMTGFVTSLMMLTLLACFNGVGQSTGWPGLVKDMSCWFGRRERGVVMAWWGTNYVIGGFLATLFATFVATNTKIFPSLGWRRGFWAPAILLFCITLSFIFLVRNQPSDVGLPDVDENNDESLTRNCLSVLHPKGVRLSSILILHELLFDKSVWIISAMYFFLKLTRYSFLFWLPIYMTQHLGYAPREAGYTSALYELVGFSGAIVAGYASDRLFQSRRFPVGAVMLWGLALVSLAQPTLAAWGHTWNAVGISLIGIMTYGPDTLMSGAAAQDVGSQEGAATAAGLIDGVGSIGQLFSPYVVTLVAARFGWNVLFYLFVVFSLIGGGLLATRWNYKAHARSEIVAG
jgi:OPA family glycerol-3-phosphate transporter-like MFS transporter